MNTLKVYTEDIKIAKALVDRDENVTREYFYKQCYPLFRSIYENYHTDCGSCLEFINEIYLVVLSPSLNSGKCQMDNFRGESSLASWIKSACLFYCYNKFQRKTRMPIVDSLPDFREEKNDSTDRFLDLAGSCEIESNEMNRVDVESILGMMPNKRYERLIRLRYLEQMSNEEVAEAMKVDMDNYYNLHKRAKSQFERIYRKEDYYG